MLDLRIVGGVVVSDGRSRSADVGLEGDSIVEVAPQGGLGPARGEIDASGLLVLPGAVDAHFHCRAPSHPQRATFGSESRAAAASGVTTFFEMPISNPPCSTPEAFEMRRELGEAESLIDFALYSGAGFSDPARAAAMAECGAIAFKPFTPDPPPPRLHHFARPCAGAPEFIFECLRAVAGTGLRCAVHSESQQMIEIFREETDRFGHPARPPLVEAVAVGLVATIARDLGAPAHIVHITSRLALEEVQAAQSLGADLSAESCPQYLVLDESAIPEFGNFVKVAPPLRPLEDVAYLWEALADGSLSVVASDHAPFTPEEKAAASYVESGQGIPSLEMLVPAMLDAGLTGRLPLARAVDVITANPAKLYGIYPRKGTISAGSEADLLLVDPEATRTVRSSEFLARSGGSGRAYDGMELRGKILTTLSRGRIVFEAGRVIGENGGRFVRPDGPPQHVSQTQGAG